MTDPFTRRTLLFNSEDHPLKAVYRQVLKGSSG